MTMQFPFGHWVAQSETSETIRYPFGQLWDGVSSIAEPVTLQTSITNNSDDGHCSPQGQFSASPSSGRIRIGLNSGNNYGGFWRFPGVGIPQGATINSASLTLFARTGRSATVNAVVTAEDTDNAPAPTSNYFGSRTITSSSVAWEFPASVDNEDPIVSPDIATIIEEVVNRPGWSVGNAVLLYVDDDSSSGYYEVIDYDYDDTLTAVLDVEYVEEAGGPTFSVQNFIRRPCLLGGGIF